MKKFKPRVYALLWFHICDRIISSDNTKISCNLKLLANSKKPIRIACYLLVDLNVKPEPTDVNVEKFINTRGWKLKNLLIQDSYRSNHKLYNQKSLLWKTACSVSPSIELHCTAANKCSQFNSKAISIIVSREYSRPSSSQVNV